MTSYVSVSCVIHTHSSDGYSSRAKSPNLQPVRYHLSKLGILDAGFRKARIFFEHFLVYWTTFLREVVLPEARGRLTTHCV